MVFIDSVQLDFSYSLHLKGFIMKNAFKPPKQKSQISLVFGMNALVPLGTIKTLSKTNLDFLYTP